MKNRYQILTNISKKRGRRKYKSRQKFLARRKKTHEETAKASGSLNGDNSYKNLLEKWLPPILSYLVSCEESDFYISKILKDIPENNGIFRVPKCFSLIENPKESYKFIQNLTGALIGQKYSSVKIDYSQCNNVDLSAQVLLDIILKDVLTFYKRCDQLRSTKTTVTHIGGINVFDKNVQKLLFSVGSPAIHTDKSRKFSDIIPYKLCIHYRDQEGDPIKIREQKDLDTTNLVDYVLDSLKTLGRSLTSDRLDDLSIVIGEILINAEEHSTTKYRFSIGYFHEINENGKHFGVFRLAILNFGKTIYEKFKDPNCPNIVVVNKMRDLSEKYNKRKFFLGKIFEEETLWTLYALQDGITSIAPQRYRKRGNGSIQFIESFFNIKGNLRQVDDVSQMVILSGNTNITFDGSYNITNGKVGQEDYKFMTFNTSGNIEEKPDSKFVKFVDNYFPGTIIAAKILFNEDDFTEEIIR